MGRRRPGGPAWKQLSLRLPTHVVIERMRVNNTVQRASAHQMPDSVRPAPEDEARSIVQSRLLVSSGAVVHASILQPICHL